MPNEIAPVPTVDEARRALARFRELAPAVMTALMATRTRADLLLADQVHRADDAARKALASEPCTHPVVEAYSPDGGTSGRAIPRCTTCGAVWETSGGPASYRGVPFVVGDPT